MLLCWKKSVLVILILLRMDHPCMRLNLLDEQILPAVIYAYMQEMDIDELGINVGMDETAKLPLLGPGVR